MARRRKRTVDVPAAMLAPAIVWMRMPILIAEALTPGRSKPESLRAVSEKVAAAAEGVIAAQMAVGESLWRGWFDLAAGKPAATVANDAIHRATRAAERPVNRKLRANYRRLSKG
jgi:hypothetical protein